jgi:signal transduction histidine kinase
MDLSLTDLHRLRIVSGPFAVDELLARMRDLTEPLARDKNVELRVKTDENCRIMAEPDRILQVLAI